MSNINNSKDRLNDRYASQQDYSRDYSRDYQSSPEQYRQEAGEKPESATQKSVSSPVQELPDVLHSSEDGNPSEQLESRGWSYFKACFVGYAASMFFTGLVTESPGLGQLFSHILANMISGLSALAFAPILLVPIRILADIMRMFQIKRGVSDVLIGALCGSVMMLPELTSGNEIRLMSICFVLGGAIGGFSYWRLRGFPTLDGRQMNASEVTAAIKGVIKRKA